jgi:hypothetical protein
MPTSFNYDGKPGYIYNAADDTWYELSGKTDTTGTFEWAGPHTHLSTLTVIDHLVAKKGINNYLNPSARDASITSPTAGSICVIRQDGIGNTVNELQFYDGSSWNTLVPVQTGKDGYFLKTNGTITSWENIPDSFTAGFLLMGGG